MTPYLRCIGRFTLRRRTIELDPILSRAVMARCIVVRCEQMYDQDAFEYVAIAPDFEHVPDGNIAPMYKVVGNGSDVAFELVTPDESDYFIAAGQRDRLAMEKP